jgi:hypothetical protein
VPITLRGVEESNDPNRSRSIDYAGSLLIAATLAPIIFGMTRATDWGWISLQTFLTFGVSALALAGFIAVERRVQAPLVDLNLLRNRVLVGSTLAILIAAGAINGTGYLLSIYFQNPATLDMSPLQAGLASLPLTIGLIAITPFIPKLAVRLGTRQTISLGFVLSTAGLLVLAFVQDSWSYAAFVVPLLALAVGMGLTNGPASAAATAGVSEEQIGAASGISNMARYVGAAVWTAAVSSVYIGVSNSRQSDGDPAGEALAAGLGLSFLVLALSTAAGVAMGAIVRHQQRRAELIDSAAAAASHAHTIATPRVEDTVVSGH